MENTTKQDVINHLDFLGYKVTEKNYSTFTKLEARSDVKLDIAVNINRENSIFIAQVFWLPIPIEKIDQKFLEALNNANSKFMFTKIFYRENDEKEKFPSCSIKLYINTFMLSYSKMDFAIAVSSLELNTRDYMEDLKEFTDFIV